MWIHLHSLYAGILFLAIVAVFGFPLSVGLFCVPFCLAVDFGQFISRLQKGREPWQFAFGSLIQSLVLYAVFALVSVVIGGSVQAAMASVAPNSAAALEQAAIRQRVLANIAESRAAREASNFGGGLSYAPAKIPRKSVARLIAQRNQPRLSAADALAKGQEVADSFAGPIMARRGRLGEVFEAVSGDSPASLIYVTRGVGKLSPLQRREILALPLGNPAENLSYVYLRKNQLLLEGIVGPQQGSIFGPRRLPGGGFQAVTESGRFGSVGFID